ncbi:hypothetical protein M5362_28610 [Streptomyces sp. Je 1-79]|uniref:hypothetical protein n=1 Tax=Streptomyces sp. Je 1-79 TaxID=2943847 RepID=UPI0021A312FF|nr:hypothetical protein [Streptomyces sp. Je 1-79]MCT4357083.1 hypothetical protein [Streptomyces sp. Je 1-79]
METLIALVAGALLIVLGTRLIHRLNGQHDARIAAYHFSAPYPSTARPPGHSPRSSSGQAPSRGRTGTWP